MKACNSEKITARHNFNFNFVAANFVISQKKVPSCSVFNFNPHFNVKTRIRAKIVQNWLQTLESGIIAVAGLFGGNIKCFQMVIPQTFQLCRSELLTFWGKRRILNIKSWKKLNFRLAHHPRKKSQGQYPERIQYDFFGNHDWLWILPQLFNLVFFSFGGFFF